MKMRDGGRGSRMVFERSKSGGTSEEKMRREGGSVCRAIGRSSLRKRYIDAGSIGEEGGQSGAPCLCGFGYRL
jgi:hypothetical protein